MKNLVVSEKKMKYLISLLDWNSESILDLISQASKTKNNPEKYFDTLHNKTMLMIFEKPSLRTRVSFEVAMTQIGGHAIYSVAIEIAKKYKISINDALAIFFMQSRKLKEIYSFDKHFDNIEGIKRVIV